jgi:hypothetical protein
MESVSMSRTPHEPGSVSFKAFAHMLGGRSQSYVTELKAAGRLVLTADGKRVRPQESLALIKATADPARAGVAARHEAARAAIATGLGASPDDDLEDPAAPLTYDGHSTRRSRALADKAEWDAKAAKRDYEESMGELLKAGDVEAAVAGAAATLRTSLENLPNTLAPELAAATDEARVRVILGEAVEHALEEISRQFAVIAKTET